MEVSQHRRAQIIDAIVEMLEMLKAPVAESGFPIQIKTVQKRFTHWTALAKQNALPAILMSYGDNGAAPDSNVIGFIDEVFPVPAKVLLKEDPTTKALIDQASDIHYSISRLINSNPTLGVEGVNPEKTRIAGWRDSEGELGKFEIIRFRIQVVHRYHSSESV